MKKLVALGAICAVALSAHAGTVTSVDAKKRVLEVEPEEGETFEADQTICFQSDAGEKIDCGTVTSVSDEGVAQVKLKSRKSVRKIKEGSTAVVDTGDAEGDAAAAEEAPKKKKKKKKGKTAAKKKRVKAPPATPWRIWIDYGRFFAAPATFNKVIYAPPTSETPSTLWAPEAAKASSAGYGAAVGIPLGPFAITPGLRIRQYQSISVDAYYFPNRRDPYALTEQKASAVGFFTDFQVYRQAFIPMIVLNLNLGLDIDMSTVDLVVYKRDDTGAPITGADKIADATSSLTVVSIRAGGHFDFMFLKNMGARLGLNLLLPAFESQTFKGSFGDGEDRGLQGDTGDDLKKALAHGKRSVAYEILAGAVFAF